jgi:hypothetical protein
MGYLLSKPYVLISKNDHSCYNHIIDIGTKNKDIVDNLFSIYKIQNKIYVSFTNSINNKVIVDFKNSTIPYEIYKFVIVQIKEFLLKYSNIIISTNMTPVSEKRFSAEESDAIFEYARYLIDLMYQTNNILY